MRESLVVRRRQRTDVSREYSATALFEVQAMCVRKGVHVSPIADLNGSKTRHAQLPLACDLQDKAQTRPAKKFVAPQETMMKMPMMADKYICRPSLQPGLNDADHRNQRAQNQNQPNAR